MYVTLQSSTCFEHQHAHLQEDQFFITASGIVTLCKRLYSMPDESRLQSSLFSSGILYRAVCSHPAYCTAVYREWRYQMPW